MFDDEAVFDHCKVELFKTTTTVDSECENDSSTLSPKQFLANSGLEVFVICCSISYLEGEKIECK